MEFIKSLVCGCFCVFTVNIVIYDILGCAREAEKDAMIAMWVILGRSLAGLPDGDGAAKSTDVADVGYGTGPCFFGGLTNRVVICSIV